MEIFQKEEDKILTEFLRYRAASTFPYNLSPSFNWDNLIDQSVKTGVAPLLYDSLSRKASQANMSALIKLRDFYLKNKIRNISLFQKLDQILLALSRNNIPVVVLKGAFLARNVYEDVGLRFMHDLDVLVRPHDLTNINKILKEFGFIPSEQTNNISDIHHAYYHAQTDELVEVHWTIHSKEAPHSFLADDIFDRAVRFDIGEITHMAMCPEDLVIHLCYHASYQHEFNFKLRSIYDIAASLEFYKDLNWDKLMSIAEKSRVKNSAFLTLHLSQILFDAPVPLEIERLLNENEHTRRITAWAYGKMFHTQDLMQTLFLKDIFVKDRLSTKIRKFLNNMVSSRNERSDKGIPDLKIVYTYYLKRFIFYIKEYVKLRYLMATSRKNNLLKKQMEDEIFFKKWIAQ